MKSNNNKLIRSETPSFYTYLKPGALAQLRYSKMAARSKETGEQTLLALCQLAQQDSGLQQAGLVMDGFPCFRVSSNYTRCLQRKKFIAVTPFFSDD